MTHLHSRVYADWYSFVLSTFSFPFISHFFQVLKSQFRGHNFWRPSPDLPPPLRTRLTLFEITDSLILSATMLVSLTIVENRTWHRSWTFLHEMMWCGPHVQWCLHHSLHPCAWRFDANTLHGPPSGRQRTGAASPRHGDAPTR